MSEEPVVDAEQLDFEATLERLERIVKDLDRDDVELDQAMQLFKEGVGHLSAAQQWLDDAAGRVEELIESASGALETRPFEDEEA